MNDSSYEISKTEYAVRKTWEAAIGLQKVDGLTPSKYLYELADENINGKLTFNEVEQLLYDRYREVSNLQEQEADIVSTRIADLLSSDAFTLSPSELVSIHRYLFKDIYSKAGVIRTENITKKEPILNGHSVKYGDHRSIKDNLKDCFSEEETNTEVYDSMDKAGIIADITGFTRKIWQIHPFYEGNTRTTAVFIEKYLNSIGFVVDNTLFAEKSLYFRNALVRANYRDYRNGIQVTGVYLMKFFENLLYEGHHELTNKELILFDNFPSRGKEVITEYGRNTR
ncbi:MAG: Fic family protein [Eubacterium sp.]|nr:Fic family protein [Eubacterium sp.]